MFRYEYPEAPFNIKMVSYQYRKSHFGYKMVVRSSYLHNGISYTGKMSYLYWIRAQVIFLAKVFVKYIDPYFADVRLMEYIWWQNLTSDKGPLLLTWFNFN